MTKCHEARNSDTLPTVGRNAYLQHGHHYTTHPSPGPVGFWGGLLSVSFSPCTKDVQGLQRPMTSTTALKLFPVVLQNDCISDHVPKQVRQIQLRSRMEDLLEPDGLCSLTSSAESKNTGLASPRPALGEQRAAGPPISFPCPSQACQRRAKPKKSDLQWLLDRLGLEQCGNYAWQEGRCAVERRGPARRNHPVPKALKEPQRN